MLSAFTVPVSCHPLGSFGTVRLNVDPSVVPKRSFVISPAVVVQLLLKKVKFVRSILPVSELPACSNVTEALPLHVKVLF